MIRALPIAIAVSAALAVAGCGGGGNSSSNGGGLYGSSGESSTTTQAPANSGRYGGEGASTTSGGASSITVGRAEGVGQVLVDSQGMTLYYFEKDKKGGSTSACSGACASAWPPLTTSGSAKATGGAEASMLGTIKRSDGTTQVTYAGWPLYTYSGDSQPSEANGTDVKAFGGTWYPLHPDGSQAGS